MAGIPFSFADITFALQVKGDGQTNSYVYRPVNPQSFVAWAPPGALSANSPIYRTRFSVTGSGMWTFFGYGTGTAGGTVDLKTLLPWVPSYGIIVPPTTSNVSKTLKQGPGEVGVPLITNLPNFLAIPNPIPADYAVLYSMGGAEDLDIILI